MRPPPSTIVVHRGVGIGQSGSGLSTIVYKRDFSQYKPRPASRGVRHGRP